jgi:tetratricopeptide (TPR) repeat protein
MSKSNISSDTISGKNLSPELKNLFAQGWEYKNQQQDYPKAIACFQKVIEQAPDFMHPHYMLGLTYIDTQEWEKVIPCFERVNELVDDEGDAYYSIAYAYQQLGKHSEAIANFRQAEAIGLKDNQLSHLYYFWAISEKLKALQSDEAVFTKFEPAIKRINQALSLQKTSQYYLEKAQILFQMQVYYNALDLFKEVNKNPKTPANDQIRARLGMAYCYTALDDYTKALKLIAQVIDEKPELKSVIAQDPLFDNIRNRSTSAAEKLAKLLK